MFHQRIKQLEDSKDQSDDEKDLPESKIPSETEFYIKKLKNTLKVYKSRCKDFEKRRYVSLNFPILPIRSSNPF